MLSLINCVTGLLADALLMHTGSADHLVPANNLHLQCHETMCQVAVTSNPLTAFCYALVQEAKSGSAACASSILL